MAGLTEAKNNYLLGKLEKRIRQTDLLIWDGMVCKIVSNPSEWGGVMVTTNLPFSQWTELFQKYGHGRGPCLATNIKVFCAG